MNMKKTIRFAFYLVCAAALLTTTCSAYIDPATTSYIIQIGAGVLIALGTVLGIFWNKITRIFRKKKTEEPAPTNSAADNTDEKKDFTADDLMDD